MKNTDGLLLEKINTISCEKLSKSALLGAILWMLSPIIIMVINAIGVSSYNLYNIWIVFLYVAGGIGWIVGGLVLYKETTSSTLARSDIFDIFKPMLFVVLLGVWCIICTCFAAEKRIAIYGYLFLRDNLFTYFFYGGMMSLGIAISRNRAFLKSATVVFISISVIMCVLAMLNNNLTKMFCNTEYTNTDGYESIFYNTNHFGYYLTIVIIACAFMMIHSNNNIGRVLLFFSFTLFVVTLIYNNTFGSYLAILLTFVIMTVWSLFFDKKELKKYLLIFLLFLLITFVVSIFNSNVIQSVAFMFGDLGKINVGENIDGIGSGRGELWKRALKYIEDKPIIGVGPQNVLFSAHNMFLQLAVYLGIPGLLIYLSIFFLGAKKLYENRNNVDDYCKAAAFIIIGFLISGFFGVTVFYTSPYFYLAVGVCMGECTKSLAKTKIL